MSALFKSLSAKSTDADFAKAVASIHNRAKTVQADIQTFILMVTDRMIETGDKRPAVKMVNALLAEMPAGVRANAIREYLEVFHGYCYSDELKVFTVEGAVIPDRETFKEATKSKWWDCDVPKEYKGLDFAKKLEALLKDAVKRESKPNSADSIDMEMVRAVQAVLAPKSVINEAVEA